MITSLRLVDFKNFADETLRVGPFTLIVGANASGKSNIRDAFRFLQRMGNYRNLAEAFGGGIGVENQPIRGAPTEIVRFGRGAFALEVRMRLDDLPQFDEEDIHYSFQIRRDHEVSGQFQMAAESLAVVGKGTNPANSKALYSTDSLLDDDSREEGGSKELRLHLPSVKESVSVSADRPVLSHLDIELDKYFEEVPEEDRNEDWGRDVITLLRTRIAMMHVSMRLSRMRFLLFEPERMRQPSVSGATSLGDSGDNLSPVLEELCKDPDRKKTLITWLRELTPMDVIGLEFPRDPSGRIHLHLKEKNGRVVSAYSASDGTLRFLGMLAALLNDHFGGLYFFEEIDNGIHPARLHLLLDLIERQTEKEKIQVIATTHSPDVLNLINETTFQNSVVVYRDEDTADSVIRRIAELPNAEELRKTQGLGRLHAGGWMESILSFAEVERVGEESGE